MEQWREICHWCDGTGEDKDAVNAASYPNRCVHCHGTRFEPEDDIEDEEEDIEFEPLQG